MAGPDFYSSSFQHWLAEQQMAFIGLPVAMQYAFCALFGLVIGSFLSVVIHRLPLMMERAWQTELALALEDQAQPATGSASPSEPAPEPIAPTLGQHRPTERYNLALPRSSCPSCGHVLGPLENLPLLGYVLSRGRCRACGVPIGLLYPGVELLSMLLAVLVFWRFGAGVTGLAGFGLCACLLVLAFIDARTHLLPDSITLPLLWAGLLLNLNDTFTPLADAVVGAAAGYVFLWLVYWAFRLVRGKEGMGYGDFKLLAALGAWFGWQSLPQIVLISALAGALWGVAALVTGRLKADQALPFGPYLAVAGAVTLLLGEPLLHWLARPLFA